MKVHVLTVFVVDFDELGADAVLEEFESVNFPNDCLSPKVKNIKTYSIGDWSDQHPLNQQLTDVLAWLRDNCTED